MTAAIFTLQMTPKFEPPRFEVPKFPQQMLDQPTHLESLDIAVSAQHLLAVAANSADPQVLLGLAYLARAESRVRREIGEMAVKSRPEYALIVAVMTVLLDLIDEQSIGELIERDPDNALGYYLRGKLLHDLGKDEQALESFRRGAHCSELRLYQTITCDALFKALDALSLTGRDRLCALSWMASRVADGSGRAFSFLHRSLSELGHGAEVQVRREISELLLVLAGHLFATNITNRWFAKAAIDSAVFEWKVDLAAAEKSLKLDGYAGGTRKLVGMMLRWPGIEVERVSSFRSALLLPQAIHRAFAIVNPSGPIGGQAAVVFDMPWHRSAREIIDFALTDPDGILGAFLKDTASVQKDADGRLIVPYRTAVEKLMRERPDIIESARTAG